MSVNCPICECIAEEKLPRVSDRIEIICPMCDRFGITPDALAIGYYRLPEDRHAALGHARIIAMRQMEIPLVTAGLF